MIYQVGDIVMYNYSPDIPYFGIITVINDDYKHMYVRWWGSATRTWDLQVSSMKYDDEYTTLIGKLPEWAETDEYYMSQLPLTRRVAEG